MKKIFTLFLLPIWVNAFGASQGPLAGSAASNSAITGSTSTTNNGTNIFVSDNTYASNTTNLANNGNYSDYVCVSGFGFSIPTGSTIDGIEVTIERSDVNTKCKDNIVSLIKAGTIGGINKALASVWPATDANAVYGGSADLWGTTWTDSDINNSGFGIAFSWKRNGGGAPTAFARIDIITIKIYYTAPLPITLISFSAIPLMNSAKLIWTTASEINNQYFLVERSGDLEDIESVCMVDGAGNSSQLLNYSCDDTNVPSGISYYRLKQVDYDGHYEYSNWVKVTLREKKELKIIPNPVYGNALNIILPETPSSSCVISVADVQGKIIFEKEITRGLATGILSISNIQFASTGLYFLNAEIDGVLYHQKFQVEKH